MRPKTIPKEGSWDTHFADDLVKIWQQDLRLFIMKEAHCYSITWHIVVVPLTLFFDENKVVYKSRSPTAENQVIAKDSSCVPPVMQIKQPAPVKVFGANYGKIMHPDFIEAVLKINKVEYIFKDSEGRFPTLD